MPWINLLGWGVTGLLLFIILSKLAPAPHGELRFARWVYGTNFALPLGFCVLNQYWAAVLAGLGSVAIAFFVFGKKEANWQGKRCQSFALPAEPAYCRRNEIDRTI
jgi:hypothetical protein